MKKALFTTLLIEKSPQSLPLGAACVASAAKSDPRSKDLLQVELIDFNREEREIVKLYDTKGTKADYAIGQFIAGKIAEKKPDFVCFSVYVWNHLILEEAALTLKKLLPDIITLAGGPEVTADPYAFRSFDYLVSGNGESATKEVLLKLSGCDKTEELDGVYYFDGIRTIPLATTGRAHPCPPEQLSSPYLDGTIDASRYGGALWELARGCPFKCSYCYESKGENRVSYFPMERIEKELELFERKKIPQVFVLDPTYNASKERALKMLKMIKQKTHGMFFCFEARAEFIDRELARAFSEIPCALQIGMQSADPEVLKNVHRTLDKKKFVKNIGYLNEAGVTFGFDLIYGLPGDTLKGFKKSIDFALSLYPNNLELFCLSVLPGTKLHDDAKGFNLVWQQMPPYNVLRTPTFDEGALAEAKSLSQAVNLFYTQGRAVSWFNSILYPLHQAPSVFFTDFERYLKANQIQVEECGDVRKIRKIQKAFVQKKFEERHLQKLLPITFDLIELYGAMSDADGEGLKSTVHLNYHVDDVLSEYALDIQFFTQNARKHPYTANIEAGPDGAVIR